MDSRVDLDIVGVLENTDKSSSVRIAWDYLRHYEALFAEFRHEPIHIVEIGVASGSSLRMWKWFFSKAQLTGVDINPKCRDYEQERVKIEIGSQDDPKFLDRICETHVPTIVIDDGSHMSAHRIFTFEHVFPKLADGGIYVVEDFMVHALPGAVDEEGAAEPNAGDYFTDVGRRCFARGKVKTAQKVPQDLSDLVDTVVFFGGTVAIRKKDPARDIPRALATAQSYLAGNKTYSGNKKLAALAHENLATYIVHHHGELDLADREVQKAMDVDGVSMARLVIRAEILQAQGKTEDAWKVISEAASQTKAGVGIVRRLAHLQELHGDAEGARKSIELARTKQSDQKKLKEDRNARFTHAES